MWTGRFDPRQRAIYFEGEVSGPLASKIYRFILDTGTRQSVIDGSVADELGYSPRMGGSVRFLGGPGGAHAGYDLEISKLSAMGFTVERYQIFCHDLHPERYGIDGLIGMDLLQGRIVTIDATAGMISVTP